MIGCHLMREMMTGTLPLQDTNKVMLWLAQRIRARYIHHVEVITDNIVGYCINVVAVMVIFNWLLGNNIPIGDNLMGGILFFMLAYARKYTIRRWFSNFIDRLYSIKAELNEVKAGKN